MEAVQDSPGVRVVVPEAELGKLHVRPDGETETVKAIVPLKPLRRLMVMIEVAVLSARTGDGTTAPADMVKSTKWKTRLLVVWVTCEPPIVAVPVTVTM